MNLLGLYLKQKRLALGLTQRELAIRCRERSPNVKGIHACSLSFWENGSRIPGAAHLVVLFDVLDLTVEEQLYVLRLVRQSASTPPLADALSVA